ncbi:hypothetical protein [Echinicola vietnamensis]|uniref:Uncharacterized protein n=1 Tax=Echinicola vietnamensis (strain DSM 17526 / LMG 23754 / KMM 6221) TaxID=926556 RepID=L0FWK4_ECHVK|nr:hypothetical protein [Echinicola vietnamensis]AGA77005.1 hypothetical protein Echvi_0728 [Echinicola vietnamensis DSM 17526]
MAGVTGTSLSFFHLQEKSDNVKGRNSPKEEFFSTPQSLGLVGNPSPPQKYGLIQDQDWSEKLRLGIKRKSWELPASIMAKPRVKKCHKEAVS